MIHLQKKLLLLIILLFSCFFSAKAQNHFYTTIKLPFTEYITVVLDGKNDDKSYDSNLQTDGISLTTGYALQIAPNFYNELGFDYLILNRAVRTSYINETRLENRNSVFAFQTKPTYRPKISADDNVFLTVGIALNYQKIYSEGNFDDGKASSYSTDKKQGNWLINAQPNLGIEFKGLRKLGYRFGLSFASYDWTTVEKKLSFTNNPGLITNSHMTSTLFFSGGFIF